MESQLDPRGREQTREMEQVSKVLRQSEPDTAHQLHHVATQLIDARGIEPLYHQILDTALAVLRCDFASLQMFCPERGSGGELRLLGHRGFSAEAAKRWEWVRPTTRTTCGEALRTRQRVAVADIQNCDFMAGSEDLDGYLVAGIHAGQSTPLVSRSGALLGMVTTYWRDPHELTESEVCGLDVLARLAADLIERSRGEETLRRSEERFRQAAEASGEFIWEVDANGLYLYASPAVEQILGYRPEEIVGRMHFYDTLHPETREETKAAALEVFARRAPFRAFPSLHVTRDGVNVALETTGVAMVDANGNLLGYRGASTDVTARKKVEAALRESEQRLNLIYNTVADVIFHLAVEPEGQFRFVSVNAAFLRVTGLSLETVIGKTVTEVIPEPSLTMALGKYRQAIEESTIVRWEETSDYPTGRLTGEVSVAPVFDSQGRCTHLVGSVHEISERKRSEDALRISQERLALSQEVVGFATWDWDVATRITHCSSGYGALYGLPPGDFAPPLEQWLELIYSEDRARVREELSQALERTDLFSAEFRVVWPDGTIHWLYGKGQVFRDSAGHAVRMIGVNMDITERKRTEFALRQSEERFRNMADTAPVMIWVTGPDKNCTFVNARWLEFAGTTLEQSLGHGWTENIHPEDVDGSTKTASLSFDARKSFQMEYRLRRADGEYRWMFCSGLPLFQPRDVFAGYIGSCVDITDIKRAREEAAAHQKLESVGTLAGGIAHDFNNLLGGVLAQAELALAELVTGSRPEEELQAIRDIAINGSEIVRQLMIYAGKESEVPGLIDFSRTVGLMIRLLEVSISKHAKIESDLGKDLPAVRASEGQLRQIVMNLVTNASEAIGDRDGVIRVTARCVTVGPDRSGVTPEGLAEGDYLQLEVSDTGVGMTLETQTRVFDPFFTTKSPGHGLGLAVVQGIVRSLQGAMHLRSELGKGTTFQILLPCAETTVKATSGPISRIKKAAPTVLVVEDEHTLRLPLLKMLHRAGFSVIEAKEGSSALEVIRTHKSPIDVLLLDITLPGTPSGEVFKEAKRLRPEMRVIATSAYAVEWAEETLRGRVECFIRKPYRMSDLVDLIRQNLS